MLLSVAAWEREVIAERTKEALATKISRGERVGRVRYGFDVGDDGKTLVANAREQEAIRLMRSLRAGGMTLRGIVDELACLGIRPRNGRRWSHRVIAGILSRSVEAA
jgi:DNA invertase Pin-like site-specific DNA recombinase